MALPSSGPLSLSDIKGEFGGPGSPSLGDYYAGGSYVPSGTSGTYGAVPTGGTISIANFYGTQAALEVISLTVGNDGYGDYGYDSYNGYGSISPNTLSFAGGAYCTSIGWIGGSSYFGISCGVAYVSSSCFTNLNANGTNFTSASATYYTGYDPDIGGYSEWLWFGGSNPLGTSGTVSCIFT
jgi:hypothetical protein